MPHTNRTTPIFPRCFTWSFCCPCSKTECALSFVAQSLMPRIDTYNMCRYVATGGYKNQDVNYWISDGTLLGYGSLI